MNSREAAAVYIARGWPPVPIPARQKGPRIAEWQKGGFAPSDIDPAGNVGVILGEPAHGLVDVDLDCPEAVEMAADFLPATGASFGRPSKPRSHWEYIVDAPGSIHRWNDAKGETLVELRSTGGQTMFPPSIHPSGEAVSWVTFDEPAHVTWQALADACEAMAAAIRARRGEPPEAPPPPSVTPSRLPVTPPLATGAGLRPGDDYNARGDIPALLAAHGWHRVSTGSNEKWRRPGKTEEHSATFNGECLFVFSSSAAPFAPDTGYSRFSAYTLLEHQGDSRKAAIALRKLGYGSPSKPRVAPAAQAGDRLLTDMTNAARLAAAAQGKFFWANRLGKWLHYDGNRWAEDQGLAIWRLAKETALGLFDEARRESEAGNTARASDLAKWAIICQKREKLSSMIALAECELVVQVNELDKNPISLNVLNGTLNLQTGALSPHNPADMLTKLAPVQFDADAACPLWLAFLNRIMESDAGRIGYLHRIAGLCLTADVREQCLFVFQGEGSNGKSVFLDTLTGLMGDYASESAPDLLVDKRSQEHPTEQADLAGRRLVVASETDEGGRLRVQLVKRLTGNARIKARFMRQDYFEFNRTHKLILCTNNKPHIRETTHAIWRRIKLVPFSVTIPDLEQDKELVFKLRDEWPGILNWAVAGCRAWMTDGLNTPEAVDKATAEYESEQDLLAVWIDERCETNPLAFLSRKDAYASYESWAKTNNERFITDKLGFFNRLRRKGFTDHAQRIGNVVYRGFAGLGLRLELPIGQ